MWREWTWRGFPLVVVFSSIAVMTSEAVAGGPSAPTVLRPAAAALVTGKSVRMVVRAPGAHRVTVRVAGGPSKRLRHRSGNRFVRRVAVGRTGGRVLLRVTAAAGPGRATAKRRIVVGRRRAARSPIGRPRVRLGTGRVHVRIDVPSEVAHFSARLNGRGATSAFRRLDARLDDAVLSATHGLRHGVNRLVVRYALHHGRYTVRRARFVVPRRFPLAAAGRDRRVRAGEPVRLSSAASRAAADGPVTHRWRMVDSPRGARLLGARTRRPRLITSRPGRHRLEVAVTERVGGAQRRSVAQVEVAAVPEIPPYGLPFRARIYDDDYGDQQTSIEVADQQIDATDAIVVATVDRVTGELERVDVEQQVGSLIAYLADPDVGKFVVVALHSEALIGGDSGDDLEQAIADTLGVPFRELNIATSSYIAFGVAGAKHGGTQLVSPPAEPEAEMVGTLPRDSQGNLRFQPTDFVPFDTRADGSGDQQNVMRVGTQELNSDALPDGAGGAIHAVALDPQTLDVRDQLSAVVSAATADQSVAAQQALAQFLGDNDDGIVLAQSYGLMGSGGSDWNAVAQGLASVGGAGPEGSTTGRYGAPGAQALVNATQGNGWLSAVVGPFERSAQLVDGSAASEEGGEIRGYSGTFGRDGNYFFAPVAPGPSGGAPYADLVWAAPTPFTGDGTQAMDKIVNQLDLQADSVRDLYLTSAADTLGDALKKVKCGNDSDCTALLKQLQDEVRDVGAVNDLFFDSSPSLKSILDDATNTQKADLNGMAEQIAEAIPAEGEFGINEGFSVASEVLYLAADVPFLEPLSILATTVGLANEFIKLDDGTDVGEEVATTSDRLGAYLDYELGTIEDQLDRIRDIIVSDPVKLATVGGGVRKGATAYTLTTDVAAAARRSQQVAGLRWMAEQLVPAAWYLMDTDDIVAEKNAASPQYFFCANGGGGYGGSPWDETQIQDKDQLGPDQLWDNGGRIAEVPRWLVPISRGTPADDFPDYDTFSVDLAEDLFDGPAAPGTWTATNYNVKGNPGLYPPLFFSTAEFEIDELRGGACD